MNKNKSSVKPHAEQFQLGPRRAAFHEVSHVLEKKFSPLSHKMLAPLEAIDLAYRTLCGILYNFVPTSGHPGGSISSGRIVESLIFQQMDYDFSEPDSEIADLLCYAAGHKAMGLYAMWALRNECVRIDRIYCLRKKSNCVLKIFEAFAATPPKRRSCLENIMRARWMDIPPRQPHLCASQRERAVLVSPPHWGWRWQALICIINRRRRCIFSKVKAA